MYRNTFSVLLCLAVLAGCAQATSSRSFVQGVGSDDLLKLRAGPSLNYNIIVGLPDDTLLNRHECVTELNQRWCKVSLANAPKVSGYVSADYLSN